MSFGSFIKSRTAYSKLISLIAGSTNERFSDQKNNPNLIASITHWIMADQVNVMNVDQAIIDLWRDLRASYVSEHNLNQDVIVRASIPFLS